jgi:hypothetical protein
MVCAAGCRATSTPTGTPASLPSTTINTTQATPGPDVGFTVTATSGTLNPTESDVGVVAATVTLTTTPTAVVSPTPAIGSAIPIYLPDVPRVSPEVVKAKLDSDQDVLLVDLRALSSYEKDHIPGAIYVRVDELYERLADVPTGTEIVTYCA